MKREYDFSKAERGKFYRRGAKMTLPIYLDTTLQKQLQPLARSQGKGIGEIVNDILKNQVQLLTTLNPSKRPNKTYLDSSSQGEILIPSFCCLASRQLRWI